MVGDLVAGRYELRELLGRGGMSSVYRAHDRLLERDVALKVLHAAHAEDTELVERFRREARAVAQLSHPNIVNVIDRGEDGGRQYIVFEYVDGESLKALVDRSGRLPVPRALELAIDVGRGLAFAHERGIVHRDVKPQNVLVDAEGKAKVTDFGIARARDVEGVTLTGTLLGTSGYIAPEQASGDETGPATDVYSLGIVLYELLTAEVPFGGDNVVTVAIRHLREPVPSLLERRPDVPPRVAAAVERALAKDPRDRFASMDELVAELEACLAGLDGEPDRDETLVVRPRVPPRARPGPAPARPRRRRGPNPLVLLLAGLALLAVAAAALALLPDTPGRAPGPVSLRGVASFDPHGDAREHPERVADATDDDPATYWPTETYRSFDKPGVGLVLDAGEAVELSQLTVVTDTPGFVAEIRAGDDADGPFRRVSRSRRTDATTRFPMDGEAARYYVVWITELDAVARVNEVRAQR